MKRSRDSSTTTTRNVQASAKSLRAALRKAGYAGVTDFARKIGKSQSAVSGVIHGVFRSDYIAGKIADAAGKPPHVLWPRVYPAPLPQAS